MRAGAIALVLVAVAGAAVAVAGDGDGEKRIFVQRSGGGEWHGDGRVFVHGTDEGFDLSELLEGETRTFGEGESVVTATRVGDVVTIQKTRGAGDENIEFSCNVTTDTCKVIEPADGGRTMLWIQKERGCDHGSEDCNTFTMEHVGIGHSDLHESLASIMVTADADCESDDCPTVDVLIKELEGGMAGHGNVFITDGGRVMHLDSDKATMRCPEGDTTMRVDKEEVEDVFLCPKHSVPLEQVKFRTKMQRIEVRKEEPHEH